MTDYEKTLEHIRTRCEEIKGEWDGEEIGTKEYNAESADELLELLKEVDGLVKELDI